MRPDPVVTRYLIETPRLGLRPLRAEDDVDLRRVFADPDARRFYPEMADAAMVCRWIARNVERYRDDGFGLWALELRDGGALIGDCGLTWQEVEGRQELEIGYHVALEHRGRGFATEAARACLEYALRRVERDLVCSIVRPANHASRTVAGRVHAHCREFVKRESPALLFYTRRADRAEPAPG